MFYDSLIHNAENRRSPSPYHSNPNTTPEQAWKDIPEKIKEVLVDLRYRGDYTPHARSLIQRYAYSGDRTAASSSIVTINQ